VTGVQTCALPISTATPSHEPFVKNEWVLPGMHFNAIGADEPGKQELDPEILKRSRIIVDDKAESIRRGETNVALSKGIIKESDIYGELSEIILGTKKGREFDSQITVFDATGIALEDVATAWEAYEKAKTNGLGEYRRFVV
jgi:alanine dehydrogenase